MAFLERDEPQQVAGGGRVTARREVLWVRPGTAGIRFLDRVAVPTCPYESRFPLSPHAWISYNQAETIRPWDTETLIENGDPWQGLKRFHRVVLDAIAEALALETAQADARRESTRRRDVAMVSSALTRLYSPDSAEPGRAGPSLPAPVELAPGRPAARGLPGGGCGTGDRGHLSRLDGVDDPLRVIARASGFRTRRVKLAASWWSEEGAPMLGHRRGRRPAGCPDP